MMMMDTYQSFKEIKHGIPVLYYYYRYMACRYCTVAPHTLSPSNN